VVVNLYADPERTVFVAHAEVVYNTATNKYQWSVKLPPNTGSATLHPVVLVNGLVNTTIQVGEMTDGDPPEPDLEAQADDWQQYSGWLRFEPTEIAYGSADTPSALTVNVGSTAPVLAGLKVTVDTAGLSTLEDIAVTAYADAVLSYPIGDMKLNAGVYTLSNVYLIPGHDVWIDVQLTLANGLTIHCAEKKEVVSVGSTPVDLGEITFHEADASPVIRLCGDGADVEDRFRLRVQDAGTYTLTAGLPKNGNVPYIPGWLGIDPEMVLYDSSGNEIARNDDEQLTDATGKTYYTNEARIQYVLSANTNYFVGVSDRYRFSGVNSYLYTCTIQ
jgi:hypothetical protein